MKPKISIFFGKEMFVSKKGVKFFRNHYLGTFALDPTNNYSKGKKKYYDVLNLTTERQLCLFIYNTYCKGSTLRLYVAAHSYNRPTPYVFWKGEIGPEGYLFYNNKMDKKKIEDLEKVWDISDAEDEEEEKIYESFIEEGKKELKEERKEKRYGFTPHLRPSGKRGIFHTWDEEDEGLIYKEQLKYRKKKDFEEMSIDDLNKF